MIQTDRWNMKMLWSIGFLDAANLQNHPGCRTAVGAMINWNILSVLGSCCLCHMWLGPLLKTIWNFWQKKVTKNLGKHCSSWKRGHTGWVILLVNPPKNRVPDIGLRKKPNPRTPPLSGTLFFGGNKKDDSHCSFMFWQFCQQTIFLLTINSL